MISPPPIAPQPPAAPSRRGRITLLLGVALAVLIGLAVFRWSRLDRSAGKQTEPAGASRAAVDDAMVKLRASSWLDFEGANKADLERRLLLLDAAIYATDAHSAAVGRLNPKDPANATAFERRDAYDTRGRVLRTGRRAVEFLREHFGKWQYNALERRVQFENDALVEQFAAIQAELQDLALRAKDEATSQPSTSPATAPTTAPATLPIPTRLPPDPAPPVDPPAAPAPP
jgi:hypothetical protein